MGAGLPPLVGKIKLDSAEATESAREFGRSVEENIEQPLEESGQAADDAAEVGIAALSRWAIAGLALKAVLEDIIELAKEANQLQQEGDRQAFGLRGAAAQFGVTEVQALALQQTSVDLGLGEEGLFGVIEAISFGLYDPENKAANEALAELGLTPEQAGRLRDQSPAEAVIDLLDIAQQQLPASEVGNFLRSGFQLRRREAGLVSGALAQGVPISDVVAANYGQLDEVETQQALNQSIQNEITRQRAALDASTFAGSQAGGVRDFREGNLTVGSFFVGVGDAVGEIGEVVGVVPVAGEFLQTPFEAVREGTGASQLERSGFREFGSVRPRDEYINSGPVQVEVNGLPAEVEDAALSGNRVTP